MFHEPKEWKLLMPAALLAVVLTLGGGKARGAATTAQSPGDPSNASTQPSANPNDLTQLSLEDLMNVEVTSVAKEPQKIANAPASVTVIGQDDIQRSGLGSIPELLRLVPGMDVAQISANQWAISTRGMNSYLADDLLVLMDGRSLYTPVFGGVTWNAVNYPLMDIDRIESIRGPGSTLWGANAVNGVVDIITKSSKDTQGLLVDARGGTQLDIGNVRYGGQIDDKTFYRVYTQYQYNGNGLQADGDPAHDEWQGSQSGFRLDRYSSPEDTLTVQGDVYEQQANETVAIPTSQDTRYYSNGGDVLGRWTHTDSDRADTSVQAYYDRQDAANTPVGYNQDTFDVEFQNRFPLGTFQDVTWGLGARDYLVQLAPRAPVTATPIYTNYSIYNGFVQDQISIIPNRLQWYLGTKVEYNSLTNLEVEPGTRLLWTPDDHNSLWASVSHSVHVTSIYQESLLHVGFATLGTQNPDSEKSNAFEIGYKVQPIKPLTFDVTGFYNTYSDLILQVPNLASFAEVDSGNAANARSYGSEISANWQVMPQWRLGASYTYLMTRGEAQINGPADFFIPASVLKFLSGSSPKNQFQVHSYVDLLKNLQWNTSLYYVDALPYINGLANGGGFQSVTSYVRLDMNLRWQIKPNMTLAVGVQNLLQNHHFEFGSINAQQLPTAVPRTFFAEWTMTF